MGGRLIGTSIQLTLVLRGELNKQDVEEFLEDLKKHQLEGWEIIDVLLDETQTKDVEV